MMLVFLLLDCIWANQSWAIFSSLAVVMVICRNKYASPTYFIHSYHDHELFSKDL